MVIEPCVRIGNGSVVVQCPNEAVFKGLVRFRHDERGEGEYEKLYSYSESADILVTLPGFAGRVARLCRGYAVIDERRPLPPPRAVSVGIGSELLLDVVRKAVDAGGGIVSVPDVVGVASAAASIIASYPRDGLINRGTPLSLVACHTRTEAAAIRNEISGMLADRSVEGYSGDDVVVSALCDIKDIDLSMIGVLIVAMDDGRELEETENVRAETISAIRNAARWGVVSSPFGGVYEPDMSEEGLCGPFVAASSYCDAVNAGIGIPVTVCWLPAPRPDAPALSAPVGILERIVHEENREFIRLVNEVFSQTPSEVGMIMPVKQRMIRSFRFQGVETITKGGRGVMNSIEDGTIRKAVIKANVFPRRTQHAIMVSSCGGYDSVRFFPWGLRKNECQRAYMVDFFHPWDVHGGRNGRLARNDDARRLRYKDMGFSQIICRDVCELPFVR